MRYYTQLTREQRYQIQALMKAGRDQTETTEIIGFHKATISRELRRNRGLRGYRSKQAHNFSVERCQNKFQPRITIERWFLVERLLR